jgi:hypothetical protein
LEHEESSCESIESVGDIDTVGSRDEYEDKYPYIEISEVDIPHEWNSYRGESELLMEPVGTDDSEHYEESHLHPCREALGPTDLPDIEIVIDESDESDTHEREYDKIGLLTVPERVIHTSSEILLE